MVRVKYRYLVVNLLYPEPVAKSKSPLPHVVQIHSPTPDAVHAGILVRLVREGVEDLYGDYGVGMVSTGLKSMPHPNTANILLTCFAVNYWSASTSTAIIRCPRDHYEMVWAALTYITRLPKPADVPVVLRVIRVSGTIKKAEEEIIRRSQLIIKRAKAAEGKTPMLLSIEKAADKERKSENEVMAQVDVGSEDEDMSE
jgi:ribonuclease P/MRP protein subunit POP5